MIELKEGPTNIDLHASKSQRKQFTTPFRALFTGNPRTYKNGEVPAAERGGDPSAGTVFWSQSDYREELRRRHRRPTLRCLVAGISKYPSKVIRKDPVKKQAKKSRVKAFVKLVNYNHVMPTRYTLDVDLKDIVTPDALASRDKKATDCKEIQSRFEERFETGKNRWFFSKLRF